MLTKICPECDEDKPVSAFHKSKVVKSGLYRSCKDCVSAQNRSTIRIREKDGDRYTLLYTITGNEYEALLEKQGGVCIVCRLPPTDQKRLCVDHCHVTEEIRGLLCKSCNLAAGNLRDNPENAFRLYEFLRDAQLKRIDSEISGAFDAGQQAIILGVGEASPINVEEWPSYLKPEPEGDGEESYAKVEA